MTLQTIANTGIRATSSDPVRKINIELTCNSAPTNNKIIASTMINLSASRINLLTTTDLIKNIQKLLPDIVVGKYIPFFLLSRIKGTSELVQIGTDDDLRTALNSENDIIIDYMSAEECVINHYDSMDSLEILGIDKCPEEILKIGGWIKPESYWVNGKIKSNLIHYPYFRNLQNKCVCITANDSSSPKTYKPVVTEFENQNVKISDLKSKFGSLFLSALHAFEDRFDCVCGEGNDGIVTLPPPFYWSLNDSLNLVFSDLDGTAYHATVDDTPYIDTLGISSSVTTLGWMREGCKNFLELTYDARAIVINGNELNDLGLHELGVNLTVENPNTSYIAPDTVEQRFAALAEPSEFEGRCSWNGNTISIYNQETNSTVEYSFDPVIKWFGVTQIGGSSCDTYGYGASYGRANSAMTNTRFKSLFNLPSNTSDEAICSMFSPACDAYQVRISPSGFIILPPGYFWMNVTTSTSVANISFKDNIGRIWKFVDAVSGSGTSKVLTDMTWVKADNLVSNMVFSNYQLEEFSGVVTSKDVMDNISLYWEYPSTGNTNCCLVNTGGSARWNYSGYSSTTPVSGSEIIVTTESGEVTLGWNSWLKCFVDNRMSVATSKTIKYGIDSNGNTCSVHEGNISSLPPGMVLVTKHTRRDGSTTTSTTDKTVCYMVPPVGWSWVNTVADNYNVVDPRGITWNYSGTTGSDQHYWVATSCKVYGSTEDFRCDFDNPSVTTLIAFSPAYTGSRSIWPNTVEFTKNSVAELFDVVSPEGDFRGDFTKDPTNPKSFNKNNTNTLAVVPNEDWMVLAYMIPINW